MEKVNVGAGSGQVIHPFEASVPHCRKMLGSVESMISLARMAQIEHACVTAHSLSISDVLLVFFVFLVVLFEVDAFLCIDQSAHQIEVFFGQLFYFKSVLKRLILRVALSRSRVLYVFWC